MTHSRQPRPEPRGPASRDRLGAAALTLAVLAALGLVIGPVEAAYWAAACLSPIALVVVVVAARRANRDGTGNRATVLTGAVLGALATAWVLNGTLVSTNAFHQVSCADPAGPTPPVRTSSYPSTPAGPTAAPAGGTLPFHATRCFPDGLQVTVSAKPYTPEAGAGGYSPGDRAVAVEITYRNGSAGYLDLADYTSVGVKDAKGRPAVPITEGGDEHRVGLGFTQLLPGMTKVWTTGFALPRDAADRLTVEAGLSVPDSDRTWWTVLSRHDWAAWSGPVQ
ncbi:hypothetical protein [Streptomyces rimosus]|uniref:hypothetical protein n=1 Tax=Streptomyces rimosus TaxID=1927 RepID=UPI0004C8E44D|nr:hypothetical protein [Streptomyces rimosus]